MNAKRKMALIPTKTIAGASIVHTDARRHCFVNTYARLSVPKTTSARHCVKSNVANNVPMLSAGTTARHLALPAKRIVHGRFETWCTQSLKLIL
jgi:hypothetical protein